VDVFFAHVDGYYRFRIEYDVKDFKKFIVLQRQGNISALTISGKYPAHFWKSKIPMQKLTDTYHLKDWERVVEIPLDEFSRDIMRSRATTTSKDPVVPGGQFPNHTLKLSNWTVYRIEFDCPLMTNKRAAHLPLCLENISHESLEKKINKATTIPMQIIPQIQVQSAIKRVDVETLTAYMPFELQYMMEHAFNLKILREYNVDVDFFKKMKQLPSQVACTFLTLLSAPQQRVYNPHTVISQIYKLIREHIGSQQTVPNDCALVRKVLVTPTSIYPLQPTGEPMNHVQYQFRQYADRFLLVQFTEEDLQPVESTLPIDEDESSISQNIKVYDRIYQVLRKGIRIARRTYEFLGTSTVDLRSHQCWFFAKTEEISRADILMWMGDFREIKKIPSFVSSEGQGFLPRLMEVEIKANEIEEIEDYDYNGYIFTNDCGKMSPAIARDIAKKLELDYTPSVVRFNLAGAKGILMISNFLTKRKIQLRASQIKF
jgi:RNA-dependent RNA polymerase